MIIFDNEYELPKLTIELAEKMEQAAAVVGLKDRIKARRSFLTELFGADAVEVITDGKTVNDCDTRRVDLAFMMVQREYDLPVREARNEELQEQMEAIKGLTGLLETATKAASMPIMNRQGFRSLR